MQRKKESAPQPASIRGTQRNSHRLSQSEWEREWEKSGPLLVAVFAAASIFVTLVETGVIL